MTFSYNTGQAWTREGTASEAFLISTWTRTPAATPPGSNSYDDMLYPTRDGSCIRDYIHVVDLAKAHVAALRWIGKGKAPLCEVFNLGTGQGNTVLEAVHTFEEVNGVKVPFVIGPRRAGDVVAMYADTAKSLNVLGWRTELTLGDALRDAWRWQLALG